VLNNTTVSPEFPLRTLDPASQSVESLPEPYVFTQSLKSNMEIICGSHYGGKTPEALCFGYVLAAHVPGKTEQYLFVGSRPGQYASAVALDWWFNNVSSNIHVDRRKTIRTLYGEVWDDAPGTGKHLVIDLIRGCLKKPGSHITLHPVEQVIGDLWAQREELKLSSEIELVHRDVLSWTIDMLDTGRLRVAEKKINGKWIARLWIIEALDLYGRAHENIPTKVAKNREENLSRDGYHQELAQGVFIGKNVTLFSSYISIGAYIGDGANVGLDVVVGYGVQIGSGTKLFAGAHIGSDKELSLEHIILTTVGDDCEIGADTAISGVTIEDGAVITRGVIIDSETDIYDYATGTTTRGCIPANAIIMRGLPFPDTDKSYNSVTIIGRRKFSAKKWDTHF
jgi:2,3,4,5-tetrahydropyridine-2-carboxylate N-succinyltransferase